MAPIFHRYIPAPAALCLKHGVQCVGARACVGWYMAGCNYIVCGTMVAASYAVTFVVMRCQTFLYASRTWRGFAFCYKSLFFSPLLSWASVRKIPTVETAIRAKKSLTSMQTVLNITISLNAGSDWWKIHMCIFVFLLQRHSKIWNWWFINARCRNTVSWDSEQICQIALLQRNCHLGWQRCFLTPDLITHQFLPC